MKHFVIFWLAVVGHTLAVPEEMIREIMDKYQSEQVERQIPRPGFNPKAQKIDVSGNHAFQPPGPNDQRGPCPGLNALANHNYLPHNGVATMTEYIHATNRVYGMGSDLGGFLALQGGLLAGNVYGFSMGGPSGNANLSSLFSQPQGLSFSHNRYEGDGSCTRGDLYVYGDAARLQMSQFKALYAKQNGTNANYDLKILNAFCAERQAQSIRTNPYYFKGPFSQVLIAQGAYELVYRLMSNKSAAHPEGVLNREVLKSFYAIYGSDNNLTYLPGYERIPDNWYRRAIGDEYTIPYFLGDMAKLFMQYPQLLNLGGNTGTTDSFFGITIENLTNGLFNSKNLFKGNNFACFFYQILQNALPDALKGLFTLVIGLASALVNPLSNGLLGCPQLSQFNSSLFDMFPGNSELLPDGTYNGLHFIRAQMSKLTTASQ